MHFDGVVVVLALRVLNYGGDALAFGST